MFRFITPIAVCLGLLGLSSCKDGGINDGWNPPCIDCPFDFRTTDFESAWSPDGSTIAYVHGDTIPGIYLIEPSGQNKGLWYASVGASAPSWSPDGEWIAFHDGAQIYKRKLNGDSLTQLTTEGRNFFPAWSPDGQWIAYSKSICEGPNTCGIWLMTSTGTNHSFLANYGNYPDWHPSGSKLLYQTRAITQQGRAIGDSLWLFNVSANNRSFLTFLGGQNYNNRHPRYSPDGTRVAFTSQPNGGGPQIWVMNADGSNARQLTTTQGYTCDWSPDGEWIVYTDSRAINGRLWLMRKDGSDKRQLTFD